MAQESNKNRSAFEGVKKRMEGVGKTPFLQDFEAEMKRLSSLSSEDLASEKTLHKKDLRCLLGIMDEDRTFSEQDEGRLTALLFFFSSKELGCDDDVQEVNVHPKEVLEKFREEQETKLRDAYRTASVTKALWIGILGGVLSLILFWSIAGKAGIFAAIICLSLALGAAAWLYKTMWKKDQEILKRHLTLHSVEGDSKPAQQVHDEENKNQNEKVETLESKEGEQKIEGFNSNDAEVGNQQMNASDVQSSSTNQHNIVGSENAVEQEKVGHQNDDKEPLTDEGQQDNPEDALGQSNENRQQQIGGELSKKAIFLVSGDRDEKEMNRNNESGGSPQLNEDHQPNPKDDPKEIGSVPVHPVMVPVYNVFQNHTLLFTPNPKLPNAGEDSSFQPKVQNGLALLPSTAPMVTNEREFKQVYEAITKSNQPVQ